MLTIKKINKTISDASIDAELFKGEGYFYLAGKDVEWASDECIPVCAINHLSLEQWMESVKQIVADSSTEKLRLGV